MGKLNRQLKLPQLQQIMMDFQKQSEQLEMKQEVSWHLARWHWCATVVCPTQMMGDAIEDAMDDELDEEETDQIVGQVQFTSRFAAG